MDYVSPPEFVADALELAKRKAALPVRDLLLRGILAGSLLAYATSLVMVVLAQGLAPIVGAALFPVGFVMLVLLGLELATGNFALLPPAVLSRQVTFTGLVRNWAWVYLGNLIGSAAYALLFYLAITNFGASNGGALGDQLRQIAQKKTLGYMATGAGGWATALVKGILCNWMVTLGTVRRLVRHLLTHQARFSLALLWNKLKRILTLRAAGYKQEIFCSPGARAVPQEKLNHPFAYLK